MAKGTIDAMPHERTYSEEEAHEILRIANQATGTGSSITRSELIKSAEEAGIPAHEILRAEQALSQQRSEAAEWATFQTYQKKRIWRDISSWAGTSVLLFGINLLTGFHSFWSIWPIGIWGLWVLGESIEVAMNRPWNDREKFEKWRTKRALKATTFDSKAEEEDE